MEGLVLVLSRHRHTGNCQLFRGSKSARGNWKLGVVTGPKCKCKNSKMGLQDKKSTTIRRGTMGTPQLWTRLTELDSPVRVRVCGTTTV